MFVNYVSSNSRKYPHNLSAARIILGVYFVWRSWSINAQSLIEWPVSLSSLFSYLYPPQWAESILILEKWLLVLAALSFLVGYRIRVSAFFSALFMSHLAASMRAINPSGETGQMLLACMLILPFGLFAYQDRLSIDALRMTRQKTIHELNQFLKSGIEGEYEHDALRWCLSVLAIVYAGAAWAKMDGGQLFMWTSSESLGRWIVFYRETFDYPTVVADVLLNHPILLTLSTWGAIMSELSLLVVTLLGFSITVPVLLLMGMHLGIAAGMGIVFFDMMFFLAIFGAFDRAYARVVSNREL